MTNMKTRSSVCAANEVEVERDISPHHIVWHIKGEVSIWHNVGHPAIFERPSGGILWYVFDASYCMTEEYCLACDFDPHTRQAWLHKYGEYLPNHCDLFYFIR